MDEELENRIRRRAYELWELDGRPLGGGGKYWLTAERELAPEQVPEAEPTPADPTAPAGTPEAETDAAESIGFGGRAGGLHPIDPTAGD